MSEKNNASRFVETVLKDQALCGRISEGTLEDALQAAGELGFELSADELETAARQISREPAELSPDMLEDVAGGTAFTAGSYNYNRAIQCPGHITRSYRTGREKEEPVFFFWSQHMIEYYCPDCQQSWWVAQEHDDPPRPL